MVYVKNRWLATAARATVPAVYETLLHKYYVDELYEAVIVTPLRRLGDLCFWLDEFIVDGLVWLVSFVPRLCGFGLWAVRCGALHGYGLAMGLGLGVWLIIVLAV